MSARRIEPSWWVEGTVSGRPLPRVLADRDVGAVFEFLHQRGWSWFAIAAAVGLPDARVREIAYGRRQVLAYNVLERIADGLEIPRQYLGLGLSIPAPREPERRVAICGSRGTGTDSPAVDEAVRGLGRVVMAGDLRVNHGPVGVGIEVLTYVADHYRPPGLREATAIFGRPNVVRDAIAVIVVGGGDGTRHETDLAIAQGIRLIPLAGTGGAARRAHVLMSRDVELRGWMSGEDFRVLASRLDADAVAEVVGRLLGHCSG